MSKLRYEQTESGATLGSRTESAAIPVSDLSAVGVARRAAQAAANGVGLTAEESGALAIVATEVATNLARHAREGLVLIRPLEAGRDAGVELLAIDRGPGIRDTPRALRDGYSTGGTAGHGLGAVARMSTEFEIVSSFGGTAADAAEPGSASSRRAPGVGTVLLCRVWRGHRANQPGHTPIPRVDAVICRATEGEPVCGDAWWIDRQGDVTTVVVADGLGHGPAAAAASGAAIRSAQDAVHQAPSEMMRIMHDALRSTRGAAVAIARIEHEASRVRFTGIGNVAGVAIADGRGHSMTSMNGIVGHQFSKAQEFMYDWPAGAQLVMHTDGLSARWHAEQYTGLLGRDPSLLAGALYRDYARNHDDETVVVVRDRRGGSAE